jgi:UDP-N-acetyl-D-glucosamine dehydrogenase
MPDFVVQRVMEVQNECGKPLKGAKILLLGLAYKPNVDDDRESPSYHLIEKLEAKGAAVSYNDPYIPSIKPSREFAKYAGRKSVPITTGYDVILISTAHDEYKGIDFSSFKAQVIDTRHAAQGTSGLVHQA